MKGISVVYKEVYILNRKLITRERFLVATEKILNYYGKKEEDGEISLEVSNGIALAIEKLKHELGYDKMISRNKIR